MRLLSLSRFVPFLLISHLLTMECRPALAASLPSSSALAKLDPILRHEMRLRRDLQSRGAPLPASPISPSVPAVVGEDGLVRVPCWLRLEPEAPLPVGVQCGLRVKNLASARLTCDEITRILDDPSVAFVYAAARAKPLLDVSGAEINARLVQNGIPPNYNGWTGRNIIVGVIDTGIDYRHEDFRDNSGTRLLSIWDQTVSPSGHAPAGFNYGREWTTAEINSGACTETDVEGHGTHVMGIAAGDGSAGSQPWTYVGIAPEASLITVKTDFYTDHIAEGVQYVFNRAQALGLPAVVNLSLGYNAGPHDGTDVMETIIAGLVGPDRIVVAAAGNSQADSIHAEATLAPGDSTVITLRIPAYTASSGQLNDYVHVDGYYPASAQIRMAVRTPLPNPRFTVNLGSADDLITSDTQDGSVHIERSQVSANTSNLYLEIYDGNSTFPPAEGTWELVLQNMSPTGFPPATIDFWMFDSSIVGLDPNLFPVFAQGMTARKLVGSPANGDSVVAVGAYVTKRQWIDQSGTGRSYADPPTLGDLAYFSSHGPRRDGVLKPDIAAPGMGIGSALSRDASISPHWILQDGVHFITQGTSMAAPHTAGVVALMLQAFTRTPESPHLFTKQVLARLKATARHDAFATDLPNEAWGFGKIDAWAAIEQYTPVFLSAVSALRQDDEVVLRWSVPVDLASRYFQVIRQVDGEAEGVRGEAGPGPSYTFVDPLARDAGEVLYWLSSVGSGSTGERMGPYIPERVGDTTLAVFMMSAPAPNPSLDTVQWTVTIPRPGEAACSVFDPAGRLVQTVRAGVVGPGRGEFSWDGRDGAGRLSPSGLYWIRANWNGSTAQGKVLWINPGQR